MSCSVLAEGSLSCTRLTCPRAPLLVLEARGRYVDSRCSYAVGEVPAEESLSSRIRFTCPRSPFLVLEARQQYVSSRLFLSSARETSLHLVWCSALTTYPSSNAFVARTEQAFEVWNMHAHSSLRGEATGVSSLLVGAGRKPSRLVSSRLVSSRLVSIRPVSSCLVSSQLVSSRLCEVRESAITAFMYFLVGMLKSIK